MITILKTDMTVANICKGFVYNEYDGKAKNLRRAHNDEVP